MLGLTIFLVDLGVMPATNLAIMPYLVAIVYLSTFRGTKVSFGSFSSLSFGWRGRSFLYITIVIDPHKQGNVSNFELKLLDLDLTTKRQLELVIPVLNSIN